MTKTSLLPKIVVYLTEWIVFFSILFIMAILNLILLVNIITVDMPWEEPVPLSSSFATTLSIIIAISLFIYLSIKFSNATRYREKFLVFMFGLNSLSCVLCISTAYSTNLLHPDAILLILIALINTALSIQIYFKYKNYVEVNR